MSTYIASKPRRANDQNWVLTILGITIASVLCMFTAGWYMNYRWSQADNLRLQQQQYQTYLRSTQPRPVSRPLPAPPSELTQEQKNRARLLAHPHVTPGPYFDKPGVQATGVVIVDALDHAQGRTP